MKKAFYNFINPDFIVDEEQNTPILEPVNDDFTYSVFLWVAIIKNEPNENENLVYVAPSIQNILKDFKNDVVKGI